MARRIFAAHPKLVPIACTAVLAALSTSASAFAQPTTTEIAPPRFVDVWFGGPLDSIYNAEHERLSTVCSGQGDDCYREELDTSAVPLAPVWPSADGDTPVGWVVARLRTEGRWPYAVLLFQERGGPEITLRENLGDWGYGSTLAIRDARGERVQPWLLARAGEFWLGGSRQARGFGIVEGPYGLADRLWRFGPVAAAPVGTATPGTRDAPFVAPTDDGSGRVATELPAAVYMVLEAREGRIRFRPEVPRDMDCGQPVDSSAEPVPVYEVPLARLLDPDRRPELRIAYGRGC